MLYFCILYFVESIQAWLKSTVWACYHTTNQTTSNSPVYLYSEGIAIEPSKHMMLIQCWLMMGQRRRQWANIEPVLFVCLLAMLNCSIHTYCQIANRIGFCLVCVSPGCVMTNHHCHRLYTLRKNRILSK